MLGKPTRPTCRCYLLWFAGNEYESPWDLESEIIQVVRQMKSGPTSPLATNTHNQAGQKSTVEVSQSGTNTTDPTLVTTTGRETKKVERSETKIDYSKHTKLSPSASSARDHVAPHRVKQPNVQRQFSSSSIMSVPTSSSVLVEGEWR